MRFPLYKTGHPLPLKLIPGQTAVINQFNAKIAQGDYRLIDNRCLCGNNRSELDTVLVEKDRYGINIPSVLCGRCGLIRSEKLLDAESTQGFYSEEYRAIYTEAGATDAFFEDQRRRGQYLLSLFTQCCPEVSSIKSVFEIGCGAGGVLLPFKEQGYDCIGCDYNQEYLDYGRSQGIDLRSGGFKETVGKSPDLLILCHVLEHFSSPISELIDIVKLLNDGSWLLIAVPGIFNISRTYYNPWVYFQSAHIYSFYGDYLRVMFRTLGLEVVYGDESCCFIIKKPIGWREVAVDTVFSDDLAKFPQIIRNYLALCHFLNQSKLNPYRLKRKLMASLSAILRSK